MYGYAYDLALPVWEVGCTQNETADCLVANASWVGLVECHLCAAGQIGPAAGASTCIACEDNTISETDGSSECHVCSDGWIPTQTHVECVPEPTTVPTTTTSAADASYPIWVIVTIVLSAILLFVVLGIFVTVLIIRQRGLKVQPTTAKPRVEQTSEKGQPDYTYVSAVTRCQTVVVSSFGFLTGLKMVLTLHESVSVWVCVSQK